MIFSINRKAVVGAQKGKKKNRTGQVREKTSAYSGRTAVDHYTLQAQKEGYPARSVYKLEEIQKRFAVLPADGHILDIGAAPGSWSLYILRNFLNRGTLCAVDLKPLALEETPDNFIFLQGDFFDPAVLERLKSRGPFDAVLSDAAPDTTGNRTVDTGRSAALAEGILDLAGAILVPGGSLTIKIFQGSGEQMLLSLFRKYFSGAWMFKPKACRKESFETYLVGTGFKSAPEGEPG